MKQHLRQTLSLALFLACFILFTSGSIWAHIYRLADRTTSSLAVMIADLMRVEIIFIGETHDNPAHHRAQLQIIRALKEQGKEIAIGLEMFRADSQADLDDWIAGRLSTAAFKAVFDQNWSDWDIYSEIFQYAKRYQIPLAGLNLDRNITSQVARGGFASLPRKQLRKLPITACNVDPAYERFIRRALGMHSTDLAFKNFCEAQLLWDMVMADNLLRFKQENPEYAVVLLAGQGHSWKHGIPAQLARKTDYTFRVLLPANDQQTITAADADYLLLGVEQAPLH